MANTAVLKVYGDIGESDPMFEAFVGAPDGMVSAKAVAEFLEDNAEATDITVRINSRGGDVQEGWAIYDLLTNSGKNIRTVGEGKIYSIATIIFLAGTQREIMKNADGLIHNPFIPPYTLADAYESTDLLKIAESLRQEEEKILDFYAQKTGTDKAKLAEYMANETKLSADDMLALGFATKILEPVKAYAYFKTKNNIMTPQDESKFFDKVGAVVANAITALGLSRLPAVAQELTDKDGNVLKLEKEAGAPAVGDAASPDGTYTMENGDVVVVADGKVTSVTPEMEETELDKANKEVERLKAELATATEAKAAAEAAAEAAATAAAEVETEKANYVAKQAEATTLIAELQAMKNSWKPAARAGADGKNTKEGEIDVARVQEIRNLKNK
jgi:ATP-dependent protease ClpP protease subunit